MVSPTAVSPRAASALRRQSSNLNIALIIGGASALAFYVYLVARQVSLVPITGPVSFARPTIVAAAVLVFVLFWVVFDRSPESRLSPGRLGHVFTAIILSLASTIIAASLLALFVVAMNDAFRGLQFDIITASLMVGAGITFLCYFVIGFASRITVRVIYVMLVVIMYAGILASAIAADTPNWYNVYLSALGMTTAGHSAKVFNFVLIFSGLMLVVLGGILVHSVSDFYASHPGIGRTRVRIIYGLFVAAGIFLAGIGLFPFAEGTTAGSLHLLTSALLGVTFVLWMWLLRFIVPIFDRSFYNFSIAIGAAIAAIYFLSTYGIYFNTTGLELSVFLLATTWLSLFLTNMLNAALGEDLQNSPHYVRPRSSI